MDHRKDDYVRGLREVGRKTRVCLMFLRDDKPFPEDLIRAAARELLDMLRRDARRVAFVLGTLEGEREWLQQSLRMAAVLGEWMLREPRWQADAEDGVVGALLHVMGKPLLLDIPGQPGDSGLIAEQRAVLRNHAPALVEALRHSGWEPDPVTLDVILNANERLDGRGYPAGKTAVDLSDLARLVAVIRVGCKLVGSSAGDVAVNPLDLDDGEEGSIQADNRPLTPAELYRYLYLRPKAFDRGWVVRLTRYYGLYPVGALVRFSSGALGWVMSLDERGNPTQVRLVRDPQRPHARIDQVVEIARVQRLGKVEDVVTPLDYGLSFPSD